LEAAGVEAVVVPGDITDAAYRTRLRDATLALGAPHHLALCHGIVQMARWQEFPPDLWDRIQDVNTASTFRLAQLLGPERVDGGSMTLVASISGKAASTVENPAYNASKAAIIALTKTLAYALAPTVRVNCVSPGVIETPMQTVAMESLSAARGVSVAELR